MYQIINKNILDFESEQKYHAIISDPPYGLAFMGKGWDSFRTPLQYQQWVTEWSSKLLDYLYPGAICAFFGGTRTYHRLATGLEDAGYEIFDSMIWTYGSGFPKAMNIGKKVGGIWEGYRTAIKPAYEPIILCRKPLDKGGYVNSVLKYGTSGLNIDGGRIGTETRIVKSGKTLSNSGIYNDYEQWNGEYKQVDNGRFPANFGLICDCEKEPCECVESELDRQSGVLTSGGLKSGHKQTNYATGENGKRKDTGGKISYRKPREIELKSNSGGASRFFYTAKASSKERELGLNDIELQETQVTGWSGESMPVRQNGSERKMPVRSNNHPTVKPIKLIEYLATLLLPPIDNSSILIPFSGVGSEMIGCYLAGWQNITGVEIDENYVNIANKRLDYWTQFDDYESAMKNKVNPKTPYQDTLVAK